jgi:fatty acid desaturase
MRGLVALWTTTTLLQSGHRSYALSPYINHRFARTFHAIPVDGRPLLRLSLGATELPLDVDLVENTAARNEASSSSSISDDIASVSLWHRERRRQMILKYGDQIARLERDDSQFIGVPLLLLSCGSLWGLAILCGSLPVWAVVLLAAFPGSMFSLWQLQLLHDVIHGSFLQKDSLDFWGIPRKRLQDELLFWASIPNIFGYYLYLKRGHLTHHKNTGQHDLAELFASSAPTFEDGDILFVAHRMHLKGDYGPTIPIPGGKEVKLSISKSGFYFWKEHEAVLNALRFAASFLYERVLLCVNDALVAVLGKNLFFPRKPVAFQNDCTKYARVATALRLALIVTVGWKALLFLFLSETLWSIPPHPACAMFVSNHGSTMNAKGKCIPTSSTYAGTWYSLFTLGTNYHCEHHDFPTVPFHRLHEIRKIAPEYYRSGSSDSLMQIMIKTFAHPEFYACMDANLAGSRMEQ